MVSFIRSLFGQEQPTIEAKTQRGLPASWYSSKSMYELERRAIFSRKWIMITHKLRFPNSGDYARFTIAGFSFFLCLDKSGHLRGFHNVCRHRGFPLVHDESGNVKILACKYHGWSYGTNGKLAKAPHFEGFSDFQKESNGLIPIHVHIDKLGFVWINLDAAQEPETSWSDDFLGVDTQERFANVDSSQYRFDHCWNAEGNFNWKTLADNYNECLHCKTSHPDVANVVDVKIYKVEGENSHLRHYANVGGNISGREVNIASTYYFPINCMTVTPHFFYLMRCVPTSEHTCSMEYEVYRHRDASDSDFEFIDSMFKRILAEDKWLCNATQKNLDAGVYVTGQLHPTYEEGPLYFQNLVKKNVMDHRAEEKKLKKEIWPARQQVDGSCGTNAEVEFCNGLDPEQRRDIDW